VLVVSTPWAILSDLTLGIRFQEPRLTTSPQLETAPRIGTVKDGRWEFLDALRGIAALVVLLQHTLEHYSRVATFSSKYINAGELGVVTFFLVSGYIIPVSIERYGSIAKFWIGRAFRLLPLYWFTFAIIVAIDFLRNGENSLARLGSPIRYILGNMTMTQGIFHVPYGINAYWTLSYEVIFYVICSLLFLFHLLQRSYILAVISASLLLAGNVLFALTLHRAMSAEKLGVLTTAFIGAMVYRQYVAGVVRRRSAIAALSIMAVAIVVANWLRLDVYVSAGSRVKNGALSGDLSFLFGYLLFALLFFLRGRQFPQSLLWLGKISYSVYLLHGIVLHLLLGIRIVWLQTVLTLVITLIAASVTYRYIEQPAIAAQRRLFPHKSPVRVAA
jgi:peptidoglycan/LPS O-acetylase OafA/YrhL